MFNSFSDPLCDSCNYKSVRIINIVNLLSDLIIHLPIFPLPELEVITKLPINICPHLLMVFNLFLVELGFIAAHLAYLDVNILNASSYARIFILKLTANRFILTQSSLN